MSGYVLCRNTEEEVPKSVHAVMMWSVLVTGVVADRWAQVWCRCGATSRAHADQVFEFEYRALLHAAVLGTTCRATFTEFFAQSPL